MDYCGETLFLYGEIRNILFHKFHEVQGAKLRDTFGKILQELRADTNADPLAKFIVYELALDKTNFELVKVLTEELALLQTESFKESHLLINIYKNKSKNLRI